MKLSSLHLFKVRRLFAAALMLASASSALCQQGPSIQSSVINGGDAQRSMVTSIAITFSKDVGASLQVEDLQIFNLTTKTPVAGLQLTYVTSERLATWTFPSQPGKSLPDGDYVASIQPNNVTDAAGRPLVLPAGSAFWTARFFRYFGDFDGDRDVDFLDTAKFQKSYIKAASGKGYLAAADVNADGVVDYTDLAAFQTHYQSVLAETEVTTPTILNAPVRTSLQSITLTGMATPTSHVVITNGFFTFEGDADATGFFSITVGLLSNRINSLFVTSGGGATTLSTTAPVTITQDSTPPFLYVDSPSDQSTVDTASVTVTGRVGDLLSGLPGLAVKVNQVDATVIAGIGPNGTFVAKDIPLNMGENFLAIVATDALGTSITKSVMVTRVAQLQMEIVSGNDQTITRNNELPQPLVVRVRDTNGQPFTNKIVNFQVSRSDGHLSKGQGLTTLAGPMFAQARTDGSGIASIYWRIGSDSGKSNNLLVATSVDIPGEARFLASADPNLPNQINVGMGNNQIGEAKGFAPLPLTAWVSDNLNGAPDVPVTFTVTSGDAKVAAKDQPATASSIVIPTDSTGHVDAYLNFGPTGGPITVEATFAGLQTNPAVFIARALVRKAGQSASFDGVVQDNTNLAIGGATCTLNINGVKLAAVVSDDNGSFTIQNAPPGAGYIQIDGRTANKLGGRSFDQPGRFPSLVYRITVVPNADNPLPTTVYLPTLNSKNERSYDGTQDIDLTIEGLAGLKMSIKGGSMTLADGTKPTAANPVTVSLNQVHVDNIPMPIQDGVAPLLTWTLQPPGAHFDPPVAIQYPNTTGLAPGSVTNFLSYNHDVERFEIVASGTVVTDGSVIRTDPGTGLLNSGWGCNCPPYSATGQCANCKVKIVSRPPDPYCQERKASFTAAGTPAGGTYSWSSEGSSGTGATFMNSWTQEGNHTVTVTYTCQVNGKTASASDSVVIATAKPEAPRAFQVDIGQPTSATDKVAAALSKLGVGTFKAKGSAGFGGQEKGGCCPEDGHLSKKFSGSVDLKVKVSLEITPIKLALPLGSPWDVGLKGFLSGELALSAVGSASYDQCTTLWTSSVSGNLQATFDAGVRFDFLNYVTIKGAAKTGFTGLLKLEDGKTLKCMGNVVWNGVIVYIKATYKDPLSGLEDSLNGSYVIFEPADLGTYTDTVATSL